MGVVTGVERAGQGLTLRIASPAVAGMGIGGSVAVNGVCLTAVSVGNGEITVNAIPETTSRTNLGDVSEGDRVNLELPMTPESLLDGHIVQGHVDGVALVESVERDGDSIRFRMQAGPDLLAYMVEKGSVTIDGISLTVVSVDESGFEVAVIPHTRDVTTLGRRHTGDRVNVEVDVLAKYVERLMRR